MIPKVAILMGCYNGAKYIAEQLDSINSQEHTNWCLYVSDDGSLDGTLVILKHYQDRWGADRLVILKGPRKGFCTNFLSMACNQSIVADYFAFCDQDDVWLPVKLTAAINCLSEKDSAIPYVYGGRTIYVDASLKRLEYSPDFVCPPSFRNAIVQSIAGGNTMVFNQAAKTLLTKVGVVDVISHDWWLYILVTGSGGRLHFDSNSYILYRQHPSALIGANTSLRSQFVRFVKLLNGEYKRWNDKHVLVLQSVSNYLNYENSKMLDEFTRLRGSKLKHRLRMLSICEIYRQSWQGKISLFIAAALNKL